MSIVFVLAAFAVPLTTGAEETGHLCFELPNDCSRCADHAAVDVCDETTEIRYVSPITDPDCGCSSANAGTYTTNTNGSNRLYVANYALGCPHTEKHTSSNPDAGSSANNSTKGFYFDFVRKNGVGTQKLTKYFWIGHIPAKEWNGEKYVDVSSYAVPYYTFQTDHGYETVLHNIVFMSPIGVTDSNNGYATITNVNKPGYYRNLYPNTMLHEMGHQLGCYDHYCSGATMDEDGIVLEPCSNSHCYKCKYNMPNPPDCIMYSTASQLTADWFCQTCKDRIGM